MAYSTAYRAFLRAGGQPLATLHVTWNGGIEPGRFATADVNMDDGLYTGHIQDIAGPHEGIDARTASLAVLEATVTLIDVDRYVEAILEGAVDQRRAIVSLRMGTPDLDPDDWDIRLVGILDRWTYNGGTIDLVIRTDDRWLRSGANRWPILDSEWNLPEVQGVHSQDVYMPVLLGTHNSSNLSATGFVPAIFVQEPDPEATPPILRLELLSLGWIPDPTAVYRIRPGATPPQTLMTDFVILQTVIGGKAVTLIQWNDTALIENEDSVQFDGSGITDLGDGTGTVLTNPVAQLRFWLVNFGHGRWLSGDWLDEAGSPISPESWSQAQAYAEKYHLEGSFRIGGTVEQRSILDQVNEWLETWLMFRPYWKPSGKLALMVMDFEFPGYGDDLTEEQLHFRLVKERDVIGRPSFPQDSQDLVKRVSMTHLFDIAGNKNWGSMDVQDTTRDEDITKTVRMTASVSRFGA